MNHIDRFLTDGAPSPLAELRDGLYAFLEPRTAELTVIGAVADWNLTAAARWKPRRVYPTPWVAVGFHQDNQLVMLNLARVNHAKLPEATRRAMELQAHQFCSTSPRQWARTALHAARYTHDGYLLVGARKIPIKHLLKTSAEIYQREREKTYQDLSPKQRNIAQLLAASEGMTMQELVIGLQRITPEKRVTKAAVHVELSRMRSRPKIGIQRHEDGRYTISHNPLDPRG